MPVMYNSFSPASSVILAMSSDEELVIAETGEEFVTFEAFDDVAAADSVERQAAVAADRGCDVVGRLGQLRELFPGVYLRVGDDDEPVARIVARAAQQPEVAGSASGRQRPEKAYDALFRRGVVPRRHADEDEPALRIGFQRVISLFVGPGESVAVGDPDICHAPAVADDASFDRNRARSPCAGAPER